MDVSGGEHKHNICTLQKESGSHVERLEPPLIVCSSNHARTERRTVAVEHVAWVDVVDLAVTVSAYPAMVPPRWAHLCVRPAGTARGYLTGGMMKMPDGKVQSRSGRLNSLTDTHSQQGKTVGQTHQQTLNAGRPGPTLPPLMLCCRGEASPWGASDPAAGGVSGPVVSPSVQLCQEPSKAAPSAGPPWSVSPIA